MCLSTPEKMYFRFIFPPIYFTRLWIDFIFPNSDPHWARRNLIFSVLCTGVNILYKHVQMSLCVCTLAYSWTWKMGRTTWDLESPPIIGKLWGVIGHLRLLILLSWFKTCIKTRSGTRDRFKDLVMCGEGVRHPTTSVRKWLPPSMCSCVCLINQAKMLDYYYPGVVGHTSIGDARIRRGRFCFSLFPFWISRFF